MSHSDSSPLSESLSQRERAVLYTALDQGYFDVPRRIPLTELANDLEMADVEPSERLRQGTATLLQQHRDGVRSNSLED